MKNFTNFYQLQKTLRFELKPVGKTLEHIEKKGLLTQDEQRAESYERMKKTIDGFHKHFIELAMSHVKLSHLEDFANLYFESPETKKTDNFKKKLEKVQSDLRKEIVQGFKTGEAGSIFPKIDKKELFTELLDNWVQMVEEKKLIDDFKTFTTYFTGFHENRKNMYTDKPQSTAIAYRLIHENLPRFLDNLKIFNQITEKLGEHKIKEIEKELEALLQGTQLSEIFKLEYYNNLLTQRGIDFFNYIIGGYTESDGKTKVRGINEFVNTEYNQKIDDKKCKIPKLKPLYKQILSDRESISFLPDAFEDDNEKTASQKVLDAINDYYRDNLIGFKPDDKVETENILEKLKELLKELTTYDLNKIYIRNDKSITDISKKLFDDWSIIKAALEYKFLQTLKIGKKGITKKQEDAKEKYLKQKYFSIAEIEQALISYKDQNDLLKELNENTHPVANYFFTHFKSEKKEDCDKEFDFIANIEAKYSCIKGLLNTDYPTDKKLHQDKKTIDDIKAFLDSLMELLHFIKPLALPKDSTLEKEEIFYSRFEIYYEQLQHLIPLYNKVRNFATQKPYSIQKFKLNFENSTLLDGWDENKEVDNTCVLLRKEGRYYLAIMDKKHNKVFENYPAPENEDAAYEKMVYKLLPGPNKMLPKVFFSDKNIGYFRPSDLLLENYKNETHKKGEKFNLQHCRELIDFFKNSIEKHEDWKNFGFEFSPTESYNDINDFYKEVEQQGYKITFRPVAESYIDLLVDEGKLYLFQIYNKDFSEHSKGRPNLHTLYWKALFDPENLKDVVYKLNGQAEVFYRKKSIDNLTIHRANEPIENKNPRAVKKQSTFSFDLIKDRRFTLDKFQFHVPITLNFKAIGNEKINNDVLNYLRSNPDIKIIGLDRGERHLIYLTLINQNGEILKQESLNVIKDEKFGVETPYHQLLQTKEEHRAQARENWGVIENIKELKEGYISQVVHRIAKMMVEENAIVVMEDLNTGFKRGRFKVEKQVYQKLEKMLIDKLNYLVFKNTAPHEPGGLYRALQLTNKFTSFKDMDKQNGFIFYVPASYTSKIDPTTGFVNLFNTKYESVEKAQEFFKKFQTIRYNASKGYFEFVVDDYTKFNPKAEGTKLDWVICTYGDRILTFRNPDKNNQWDNKEIQLTEEFEDLFGKNHILYGDGSCLKEQIIAKNDKEFLKSLLDLFKLTVQMRNSITNSEVDYLISPVMNSKKEFYDSRKADASLPKDADANGAYHIAKKGLQWVKQIQNFNGTDWKKLVLDKTNKGWLNFVQKQ